MTIFVHTFQVSLFSFSIFTQVNPTILYGEYKLQSFHPRAFVVKLVTLIQSSLHCVTVHYLNFTIYKSHLPVSSSRPPTHSFFSSSGQIGNSCLYRCRNESPSCSLALSFESFETFSKFNNDTNRKVLQFSLKSHQKVERL